MWATLITIMVKILKGVVRHYDWGSPTVIPHLLGLPPNGKPWAELWLGAHPTAPATVDDKPLNLLISKDPHNLLGSDITSTSKNLPFLMKVLAVEHPLSLQVHPTVEQAQEGFKREQAMGIPIDSPKRSFRDSCHKPELVCALTSFELLCGFRDVQFTLALLDTIHSKELDPMRDQLRKKLSPQGLHALVGWLLSLEKTEVAMLLNSMLRVCSEIVARNVDTSPWTTDTDKTRIPADSNTEVADTSYHWQQWIRQLTTAIKLGEHYPQDAGVIVSLLLNYIILRPGEAMFLPPGTPHCYLRGSAVEVMACSDNVVRGGLTSKHTDINTLLEVIDTTPLAIEIQQPKTTHGITTYESHATEFSLTRIELQSDFSTAIQSGPAILLCTNGRVQVNNLTLERGQAAWISFSEELINLKGLGTAFVCSKDQWG